MVRGAGRGAGVALILGSGLSNRTGASVAAPAFPVLGPAWVVAVRQWVAAVVLGAVGRPRLRHFTAAQWRPVLGLALVFAGMNLSLYMAIERIGLGLAVTLEFLGPPAVALAGSRRRADLAAAVAAAGTVAVSATPYLPVGAWVPWHHPPTPAALGCALTAGVLSSAVPFLADLLALRRVPAHFFGMFMSVNPVFAAVVGLAVLGQRLDTFAWLAIAVIVAANTAAASAGRRRTA